MVGNLSIGKLNKTGEDNIHTAQESDNRSHHELRVLPSSPNLSVTENSDNGKSNDEIPESPQINYYLSDQNNTSDNDYLAAVENGDMETAQRMVDEAARKAGYNPETDLYIH